MVKMMGPWGEIIIAAGLIVSVCGAYLSWTIMAAEDCRFWRQPINPAFGHLRATKCQRRAFCIVMAPVSVCTNLSGA